MSVHAILITANYHIASHNRSARRRRGESRFSFSCGALDSTQCLNAAHNDVINQSERTEIKAVSQSTSWSVVQSIRQSVNSSVCQSNNISIHSRALNAQNVQLASPNSHRKSLHIFCFAELVNQRIGNEKA